MQLAKIEEKHLKEMMRWFKSEQELSEWSGPNFEYPFDLKSFKRDLKLDSLNSYALISGESKFLAFGQFYNRLGRCHLGRLVVNPRYRGEGLAFKLMTKLCDKGKLELNLAECSLFVLANNESAIRAYKKFGFVFSDYPEEIPLENCLYMIKSQGRFINQ